MPIYVYRFADGREVEHIVPSYRDVTDEIVVDGETARRVPTAAAVHFANPQIVAAAQKGLVPAEPGMLKDQQRYARERQAKEDHARRTFLAEQLAGV